MDLLKKLFILTLFLFPLGEVIRINLGNGIVLKPMDIGVGLCFLLWLISKYKKKESIKQKKILISVSLFAASALFSLLINYSFLSINQFIISFLYLMRWIIYSSIFFIINDFDKEFKKTISNSLIIVGSIIVGLGYLQYFFFPSLKGLFYLGWDEHMHRMFSVFLDPNFAGAFFVLFFLFLVDLFLKKKSLPIGILSILTLGGVFLTFSRSALIMLIISSSLIFLLYKKKVLIMLLLGIVFLVLIISSKYFNIENVNLFRSVSTQGRIETTKNAIKIIQKNPIFGVGFNSYRYAQLRYKLRNDKSEVISHADSGVDNSMLFVLATTGIIGFLFYSFMWIRIFKNASGLIVVSIIGLLIDSLFINSLFYTYIMLWLWIVIGLETSESTELKVNK